MNYAKLNDLPGGSHGASSRFAPGDGATEVHLCLTAGGLDPSFSDQLGRLELDYAEACVRLGLPPASAVFRRVFASDLANQAAAIEASPLVAGDARSGPVAVSLIEEPPLPERKLALWAWHVADDGPLDKVRHGDGVALRRDRRTHLWTVGLASALGTPRPDPEAQTRAIFSAYADQLAGLGASLDVHAVRTWLFVPQVDVNYAGMVAARRELFAAHGLTAKTHFLASTGIQGRHADPRHAVILDAYAVAGLQPGQVRQLEALDHLGPTHVYGVTFERGTRVDHGDRAHVVISGTASIDPAGDVLHEGDVVRQAGRTLDNIAALLADGGATLDDLANMIVYLRDPADRRPVEQWLAARLPRVPRVLVHAPVCRPTWLIEIECWAIVPSDQRRWPSL